MKRFLTRACAKIGRFFWSWGFLKFILWSVTLIILFYAEEDWRGARAWAATKAKWEAKGETFDYNKLIPPPVPDDENLAAIPLFKLESVKEEDGKFYLEPSALNRAMRGPLLNDFPSRGNWMRGELPDMAKIQKTIAADYADAFKGVPPPGDTLAQFDALNPFLTDLRAAAATRPLCRFNLDYETSPPANRVKTVLTDQIRLSDILMIHAILALDHHQPVLALEDIKTNYKLLSGVKRDPTLIGGLLALAMNAIGSTAIYDGLALHAWNDDQLAEIERMLESIDFLTDYQFATRSEAAYEIANMNYFMQGRASKIYELLQGPGRDNMKPLFIFAILPWPNGWRDDTKSRMAAFLWDELATVDPQSQRVFPNVSLDLEHQVDLACARWDASAPWNIWFSLLAPNIDDYTQKFAYAQNWINETRLACALERYRLAHNAYPDSLDALVSDCIDELPHDIINGQPYHYRLRTDGAFLLYSVGWNQTDDGGKIVFQRNDPNHRIDDTQGNWVWPTPEQP